jgi:hypothetical protein
LIGRDGELEETEVHRLGDGLGDAMYRDILFVSEKGRPAAGSER